MNFISLYTGIGGFDLGFERAGMKSVGQIEIDPFCQLVLEKHWPQIPKWYDIRNFRRIFWETYCEENRLASHVDLVCGGFPCQDISLAGRGAGLKGKRSRLWYEMFRIIREWHEANEPFRWVVVENVPALRTRGADTVIANLESLGYTCWPIVVGAWAVGAPHQRNRIWIVAELAKSTSPCTRAHSEDIQTGQPKSGSTDSKLVNTQCPRKDGTTKTRKSSEFIESSNGTGQRKNRWNTYSTLAIPGSTGQPRRRALRGGTGPQLAVPTGQSTPTVFPKGFGEEQHKWEPARFIKFQVGCDADGIPARLVRLNNAHALRAFGNAVVPDVVQAIGAAIHARHYGRIDDDGFEI